MSNLKTPANAAADAAETAGRTTTQGVQEAVETAAKNPLVKKIVVGALAAAAVIGTILAVNKKDNAEAKEAA